MDDLSKLSDAELTALYQQNQTPDVSKMSDAELTAAYNKGATSGLKRVYITGGDEPRPLAERAAETGKGLYKALDAGVAAGVAGLGGAVGDLSDLGALGIEKASNYVSDVLGVERYQRKPGPSIMDYFPRAKDVQKHIQDTYYGGAEPYKPQGPAEEYAKTIGEFAPGALMGGGGAVARAGQVLIPAVTSETAGRLPGIRDTKAEPIARFLGALTGGGVSAFLNRPNVTRAALETQLPRGITAEMVDQADVLMQDALGQGVRLSWPQALSQVAGRPVLSNLQRHLEASPMSEAAMGEFFATQPRDVARAGRAATAELSPGVPMLPENIGPEVGRTAFGVARDVERVRSARVDPFYTAANPEHIPVPEMAGFIRNLDQAIAADRTGIVGGRLQEIRNLLTAVPARPATAPVRTARETPAGKIYDIEPGRPAVAEQYITDIENVDRVRKYVRERMDAPQIGADAITKDQGRQITAALDDLERRMVAASQNFERGKALYQDITERHVRPLMEGPLGKLADRDLTTRQAIETLFPKEPLVGGEVRIGQAVQAVASRSPRAASDLVRAHTEAVFDRATRDLQTGPNQALGGKFRAQLAGSEQQRANLQAAVEALPDGAERWQGFNRFLDIAEATGTRQNIGSRTAYNQEIKEAMGTAGGIVSTGVKIAGKPTQFLQPLAAKFDLWRARSQLNELASILTDPRSAGLLRELARTDPASRRAASLSLALVNYANAIGARNINKPNK